MAEIVREGDGFGQVFVEAEKAGESAGDLGDLEGMGEAGAIVVAGLVDEDLGFVFEPSEGGGVNDPVAIPLKTGAELMFRLGVEASERSASERSVGCEDPLFPLFDPGAG